LASAFPSPESTDVGTGRVLQRRERDGGKKAESWAERGVFLFITGGRPGIGPLASCSVSACPWLKGCK